MARPVAVVVFGWEETYMRLSGRWYKGQAETLLRTFTLGSLLLKDEVPVPGFHLCQQVRHQHCLWYHKAASTDYEINFFLRGVFYMRFFLCSKPPQNRKDFPKNGVWTFKSCLLDKAPLISTLSMLVVINTAFTISLVLLANAEPEAQFGGRLGFPSIGGPLKLRLTSLHSTCQGTLQNQGHNTSTPAHHQCVFWMSHRVRIRVGHAPIFADVHRCASDAHRCAWTASLIKNK